MDKEIMEYFDQKWFSLASKEDVEKLRQEAKANFRQSKEETKTHMLELKKDIKADVEQVIKEMRMDIAPIREEMNEGLQKVRTETQSALNQLDQDMEASLQQMRGPERLNEQMKLMVEEVMALNGRIKAGFTEVKEELGSMIRFSYADLEKKFNALEVRIKALEKMIFP